MTWDEWPFWLRAFFWVCVAAEIILFAAMWWLTKPVSNVVPNEEKKNG